MQKNDCESYGMSRQRLKSFPPRCGNYTMHKLIYKKPFRYTFLNQPWQAINCASHFYRFYNIYLRSSTVWVTNTSN